MSPGTRNADAGLRPEEGKGHIAHEHSSVALGAETGPAAGDREP